MPDEVTPQHMWRCKACRVVVPGGAREKPWIGPCPNCGRSRDAERVSSSTEETPDGHMTMGGGSRTYANPRISTGLKGFDDVVGGGLLAGRVTLLGGFAGSGKCLGRGTLVLKIDGSIVPVESVEIGDELMGPDSTPRRVLSTARGRGPLYKIIPKKGESWVCNDVHMLTLIESRSGRVFDMPLDVYLRSTSGYKPEWKLFQPEMVDFQSPHTAEDRPVSPYFIGIWLGDGQKRVREDGHIKTILVFKPDAEIAVACRDEAARYGLRVSLYAEDTTSIGYGVVGERGAKNQLLEDMRRLMPTGPRVPPSYLFGPREVRLEVLAGLLDTDGYLGDGYYEIAQKNEHIADDISFLARSLGLRVTRATKTIDGVNYQRLAILGHINKLPLRIPRKRASQRKQIKNALRTGFRVEAIDEGEYFGFELDGDGRFLLGDFTVTHNTRMLLLVADHIAKTQGRVIYATGEESADDVQSYCVELGLVNDRVTILGNQDTVEDVLNIANKLKPFLIIYDSAQKFMSKIAGGLPGSMSQCKAIGTAIKNHCGTTKTCAIIVNQMSSTGDLKGGTELEHHCDTVLVFGFAKEYGDEDVPDPVGDEPLRVLSSTKNRKGSGGVRTYWDMLAGDIPGKPTYVPPKSKILDFPGKGKYRKD